MKTFLFHKAAAQLAHLVHARLSPFTFLLHLSLLSCVARILLSLATSVYLHKILASTSAFLQGLHLNLDATVFKAPIASLGLHLIFFLTNFIILALLFSSKRGSAPKSFDEVLTSIFLEGERFDQLADHDLVCNDPVKPSASVKTLPTPTIEPPPINSAATAARPPVYSSPGRSPICSAPPLDLGKSCDTSALSEDQQLLANIHNRSVVAAPSMSAPCSPLHINGTCSNHLDFVPSLHANSRQKNLFRHKSDSQATGNVVAAAHEKSLARHQSLMLQNTTNHSSGNYKYASCGRTVLSTYYYEYRREESCSTTRLYTSSELDSLSQDDANKHFSEFASRKWASMRSKSKGKCQASPPPSPLRTCKS